MKKVSIIIPAYNEESTIEAVVNKVLKQRCIGEIIIIDDNSKDNTLNILKKSKFRRSNIEIIKHKKNFGKGGAIVSGIKRAKYPYILIQDADLEYNPDDYKILLKKAGQKKAVYGSRLINKNPHAYELTYLGNVFLTTLHNILFRDNLTDSYTCYKLIPTKIARSLKLKSNGFEIEAEITAKLKKRNIPIIEVPISYSPRKYEDGKKIKAVDALKGAFVFLKIRFDINI